MPKPLNMQSGMPQMNAAFSGWTIAIKLVKIVQTVVEGFVRDIENSISVMGAWQPLSPEEIALKPDGQRSWEWINLHIHGNTIYFETNDRIKRNDIPYKVMAIKDWRLSNYTEYHLVRDYETVSEAQYIYVYDGDTPIYDGNERIIEESL